VKTPPLPLLSTIALASPLALNLFVPAMPDAAQALETDINTIQMTFTAYLFTLALGQLVAGPLADFYGRRPVLISGLLLHSLGSLLAITANDVSWLIAGRVLQAAGGSTAMSLARTIIIDVYGREGASSKMGYMVMSIAIAQSVAPTLGGFLNLWYGWQSSFVIPLGIGLIVATLTWRYLPETCAQYSDNLRTGRVLSQYRQLLGSAEYLGYALSTTFIAAAFYMFVGSSPYLVVNQLGGNSAEFGSWFMVVSLAFMAGSFLSTRLARHLNIDQMVLLGNSLSLAGGLTLLACVIAGYLTLVSLFLPMAIVTLGRGLSQPNAQSGAIASSPGSAGTASGLMGFIQLISGSALAQLTPVLMASGLTHLMICLASAPALAMSAHGFAIWKRTREVENRAGRAGSGV
jgi:MFS transporter, DHA1 family, multidrug resistance protein